MTKPIALPKLPQALRDKATKVDMATSIYLTQAATAIDTQQKKIAALKATIKRQNVIIDQIEWIEEDE